MLPAMVLTTMIIHIVRGRQQRHVLPCFLATTTTCKGIVRASRCSSINRQLFAASLKLDNETKNNPQRSSRILQRDYTTTIESSPDTINEEDTIYALSSGGGGASSFGAATAVSVIRISGTRAFDVLRDLLSPYPLVSSLSITPSSTSTGDTPKLPKLPKVRMASLRTLYDPLSNNNDMNVGAATLSSSSLTSTTTEKKSSSTVHSPRATRARDPLDSALVITFAKPNSFTGEDIVELHCHGSRGVVSGVLSALSSFTPHLRPADPGEFTSRAYSNGKLGLVEVEALSDLIVSDTSMQRKQALRQFDGRLSRLYQGWRTELIKGMAHAEAVIDFGDDETLDANDDDNGDDNEDAGTRIENDGGMGVWGTIQPRMSALRADMDRHLADASRGELLRDGIRVAIVGRPNAGKSSLLNLLAGRDAAIVSSTPGTTRDVVEVVLDLGGVRCALLDTAGVRDVVEEGVNDVEVEGMRRARIAARDAHIVVGVVDAGDYNRGLDAVKDLIGGGHDDNNDDDDMDLIPKRDNVLYVLNKLDLIDENDLSAIHDSVGSSFGISCTTGQGVESFLSSLTKKALSLVSNDDDNDRPNSSLASVEGVEGAVITRARHRRHVEAASEALARFEVLSGQGHMSLDVAAEELRLAASELGRITGAIDVENVLDVLFADFCIGK
jgi:tRNA modification GTPase